MVEEDRASNYKDMLLYMVGKLADYKNYCTTLENLYTDYDETLEICKVEEWFGESGDTIAGKALHMLGVTLNLFEDMQDNAIYEIYHVIKDIAGMSKKEQIQLCGIEIMPSLLDETIFNEMIFEWDDPPYSLKEAWDSFLMHLRVYCSQ